MPSAFLLLPENRPVYQGVSNAKRQGGAWGAPEERGGDRVGGIALVGVVLEHQAAAERRLVAGLVPVCVVGVQRVRHVRAHLGAGRRSRGAAPRHPDSVCTQLGMGVHPEHTWLRAHIRNED